MAVDPITAEIIRNSMESTSAEVIQTMVRTAVSPMFNEAHDCSAGVFYYDGEDVSLVSRADAVPVHIFACLTSVEACVEFFHGDLAEGDVLLVCDPFYGGTHIADYTVVKPIFIDGQPMFFPSVRAHMLDPGGPVPGGSSPHATEAWQEGFRFCPVKLYERGHLRQEMWDWLKSNNRIPDDLDADLAAMVGGCAVGERRIRALCDRYGIDVVRESLEHNFDSAERALRAQIAEWPDGTYRAESFLDDDWAGNENIKIAVALTIEGDTVTADFTGSAPQTPGIINSVPGNTLSYLYGVFAALCPDVPLNSGFFRPLKSILPPGSVVDPAAPAATAGATVCIGCDIGEAIMKACEQFTADRVGTATIDLCDFWGFGTDSRTGEYFIHYDYQCSPCSSGGTQGVDGWGAWSALFCALDLASIEMSEVQYPALYRQAEYTTDSAAPGQWRGSPAYAMQREPYGANGTTDVSCWVQGLVNPLYGYEGGRPGAGNYAVLRYGTDAARPVTTVAFMEPLDNGDRTFWQSSGGGGWGDSLQRDPAAVLEDVLDEYVSVEGARHDYGVCIDAASRTVDAAATAALRAELRSARAADPEWLALGRRQTLERAGLRAVEEGRHV